AEAAGAVGVVEADAQGDPALEPVLGARVESGAEPFGLIHLHGDQAAPVEHAGGGAAAHVHRVGLGLVAQRDARAAQVGDRRADAHAGRYVVPAADVHAEAAAVEVLDRLLHQ